MKDKIERVRNILYKAADLNVSYDLLLQISQKLDKYIVEYLRESESQKGNLNRRKNEG
ncbi:MAG: Spo0E family sporulation regulatory protein-aspartic acid phosphatase [Peptococcia bacterium]|jgi:hypothetical protein